MKIYMGKSSVTCLVLACATVVLSARGEDRKERVLRRLEAVKVGGARTARNASSAAWRR